MGVAVTLDDIGGWPAVLAKLLASRDLTSVEAAAALSDIFQGNATSAQIAAFAVGLRIKGETIEEMSGLVRTMLEFAEPVRLSADVIDTCGTGGDRSHTINVSTLASFVVAGAGVPVCKHGGRAASSQAGSADVLEALGVVIDLGPQGVARCVEEAGIGFCFAPRYHPAMRHAIPIRRELGVPTAFNFLGPLANPARVRRQVVGVGDPAMAPKMAGVLAAGGATRVMVVHGSDGLDELSTTGPSTVHTYVDGRLTEAVIDPRSLGLSPAAVADLQGGDPHTNAVLARAVLSGEPGPRRDIVLLNAAAGLVVGGLSEDLPAGMKAAAEAIDDGRAMACLDRMIAVSQEARAQGA